jgi:hypothetical protein
MAMWKNPDRRKIDGHIFTRQTEGQTKRGAKITAGIIREHGGLARIVQDERIGHYDVRNRSTFYCVYVAIKPMTMKKSKWADLTIVGNKAVRELSPGYGIFIGNVKGRK